MPRSIDPLVQAALEDRRLVARDFLWIVARDRDTGADVPDGVWSDVGSYSAPVIDPDSGSEVTRDFTGSGTLVEISDIPMVANLAVQTVTIKLSQVSDHINDLVRTYDCKQARVQIFRGLFDPVTRILVAAANSRFNGFIDQAPITTSAENEEGSVSLAAVSHAQEMTRSNPDTRSHESQKLRSATDTFFKDSGNVQDWEIFWGSQRSKVPSQKRKKFLGIF